MFATHGRSTRVLLTGTVVAAMSVATLAGSVDAQSQPPVASAPPASTAPESPATSPAALPSTAPVDPAIAACDALLTHETIATVTGATVTDARAGSTGNGNFPESPNCDWTLSDGSSIKVDTMMELSAFGSGNIEKAMALGGSKVTSLPQPAASVVWDGGDGQLFAGRVGPLLIETLTFSARSADGKADDLDLLERLALASAAQPTPARTVDPECASDLGVSVVSTQRYDSPSIASDTLTDLNCGFDLGDGTTAVLELDWRGRDAMPDCCEKVKALGKGAFAQQQGSGKKAEWQLEWVLADGDPSRVAALRNGEGGTRMLSKRELTALAKDVTLGDTVASGPTPGPAALPAEAAPLFGSWTLLSVGGGEKSEVPPAGFGVIATFNADGTTLFAYDCVPPKKKKPLAYPGTYTADATTLHITWAKRTIGACKADDPTNWITKFGFMVGLATGSGTWSVVGDTLTITGNPEKIVLEFQRAATQG